MISYPLKVESIKAEITPETVGNKAYNLMAMSTLGLPVPNGFVIPISAAPFSKEELISEFNIYNLKLPVSVRSGAAASMPGMMDTILNIGSTYSKNDEYSKLELAFKSDCYLRLIESIGCSIFNLDSDKFNKIEKAAHDFYIDDPVSMNEKIIERYLDVWSESEWQQFPEDWEEQLWLAALAVKDSWNSQRAIEYREAEGISHNGGTAILVQEMVFGNFNERSGTGVVFSHNPNTGKPGLYGDFLPFAQGEDIVSGSKVPMSIDSMLSNSLFKKSGKELKSYIGKLLRHFKSIQDVEFTIEDGTLYILQTRSGKCSPKAYVRSALSMVSNGSMSILEATDMIMASLPKSNTQKIVIDENMLVRLGFGIGVAEGEVAGVVACSRNFADEMRNQGKPYIFCADITSPNDTEVMRHSAGVLTAKGGRLSHAAVLARSMSKPTVVGFESMTVSADQFTVDEDTIKNGDMIKIDGTTGAIHYLA